jgi:SCY1-like protein 1
VLATLALLLCSLRSPPHTHPRFPVSSFLPRSQLTAANLDKLARFLARLQADESPSIRTNTIIFIGKLAPKLSASTRDKIILPTFARGLKDPFPVTRTSSLKALVACRTYFDAPMMATSIMPGIMPLTVDPSGAVRADAFKAIETMMDALKKNSKEMDAREAAAAAANPNPSGAGAVGAANTGAAPPPAAQSSSGGGGGGGGFGWLASAAAADAPAPAPAPAPRQQQQPQQT